MDQKHECELLHQMASNKLLHQKCFFLRILKYSLTYEKIINFKPVINFSKKLKYVNFVKIYIFSNNL